jgi:hypothetical protein
MTSKSIHSFLFLCEEGVRYVAIGLSANKTRTFMGQFSQVFKQWVEENDENEEGGHQIALFKPDGDLILNGPKRHQFSKDEIKCYQDSIIFKQVLSDIEKKFPVTDEDTAPGAEG